MPELDLFSLNGEVTRLQNSAVALERELQNLIENHMELFFGVRFLKSEYQINGGRMDSIGLDENNCPVIFEYKRNQNQNVINQGLFYLDWLLDHKADFKLLVMEKLGAEVADQIDWSVPCVVCVAQDFTKYDIHAVNQMQRNIKLVRYRKYEDHLILFEHLNAPDITPDSNNISGLSGADRNPRTTKSHLEKLESLPDEMRVLYDSVCDFIESLGDDISSNQLRLYLAYRKVQNVICIEISRKQITLFLKLDPETVSLEDGFSRDMRHVGHYGTGNLQLSIKNMADLEKAKPLIERAYLES